MSPLWGLLDEWRDGGFLVKKSGTDIDAFGHVTPCLLADPARGVHRLYVGAAPVATWGRNRIRVMGVLDGDVGRRVGSEWGGSRRWRLSKNEPNEPPLPVTIASPSNSNLDTSYLRTPLSADSESARLRPNGACEFTGNDFFQPTRRAEVRRSSGSRWRCKSLGEKDLIAEVPMEKGLVKSDRFVFSVRRQGFDSPRGYCARLHWVAAGRSVLRNAVTHNGLRRFLLHLARARGGLLHWILQRFCR